MGYGGQNRTHGTVEDTFRIDSFQLQDVAGSGLFWCGGSGTIAVEACYIPGDYDSLHIFQSFKAPFINGQDIAVVSKTNGFGGKQLFFRCPYCDYRVRYLYYVNRTFTCRRCGRLNYRSQQRTKEPSLIRSIFRG